MLFHYDLSVLIDVLLVVGTIVAAYCQKNATKAMEQEAKNNKREKQQKQETKEPRRQMPQKQKQNITFLQNIVVVLYF